MIPKRKTTRFGVRDIVPSATTLAVVLTAGWARANAFYDPTFDRMAITDRSTAADIQPRVWILTAGAGTPLHRALFTKIPDLNAQTWLYTGFQDIDSGIDAVSWTDGNTQRQRVFFTTAGEVHMMPFDNDQQSARIAFAGGSYVVSGTDLAAVTFVDGGRRIAVAGGTSIDGTPGYICIWESGDGLSWARTCSADRPMPVTNPPNHDIVGVNLSGTNTVQFYFRNAAGGLSRIRRIGTSTYAVHEDFTSAGTIQPRIAAIESQVSSKIELAVISTNNVIFTSRISPTSIPSWSQRAAPPNGATPSNSPSALSMVKYHGTDFNGNNAYTSTTLFVMGSNLGLYLMSTDNSGTWAATWGGPHFSPSGWLGSIGAVTTTTGDPFRLPRLFVAAGYPTYTLQEYFNVFGQSYSFHDHIKYQLYPVGTGDPTLSVAETSGAADTSMGIMTAVDRNLETTAPELDRRRNVLRRRRFRHHASTGGCLHQRWHGRHRRRALAPCGL